MSLVKWVDDKHLILKTQPDLYSMDGRRLTEVIPLADLAEVVEGLQVLSGIPGEYPQELLDAFKSEAYDAETEETLSFSQWFSNRLLVLLAQEVKKGDGDE